MKQPVTLIVLAAAVALLTAPALAANNGNHGNSGSHGNAGGNGNGNAFGQSIHEADINSNGGTPNSHANIAALAGAGNAAHASVQGLLHASPHSAVGRVKVYADLNFEAQKLDQATAQALTDCNTALAADSSTSSLGGDCSTLTLNDLETAGADQATIDAFNTYLSDKQASDTADASAQQALLGVTKNAGNTQVKTYIDGLLAKYYAYLSTQP